MDISKFSDESLVEIKAHINTEEKRRAKLARANLYSVQVKCSGSLNWDSSGRVNGTFKTVSAAAKALAGAFGSSTCGDNAQCEYRIVKGV
jgi:hypothetical protein